MLGQVVAEDADIVCLEDFAQLDCSLKSFQVRLEWFVDFDLPDGRADSAEPKAMFLQKRFELADLQIGQVQYVGFENRSKLDVSDAAGFQHVNLLLRVRTDFIREGAESKHCFVPTTNDARPVCLHSSDRL